MASGNMFDLANRARRQSNFPRHSIINTTAPVDEANAMNFSKLPDKLILKIFSNLTLYELCQIAPVSQRWRALAYDPSLWRHLNLRPEYGGFSVSSPEMLQECVLTRAHQALHKIELNSELITVPILEQLAKQCALLRHMTLDFSNAMQLHDFNDLNAFPASLYSLTICLSDVIFMEGLMRKIYQFLSPVEVLHLIGTFELSNEEEEEIYEVINISKIKTHTPNLRVINLFGVSFVDDSHVELLANNCIHLETVALNFCLKVTGSALPSLMNKCTKITTLLMQHCGLKDEYMLSVNWAKTSLQELDITSTELSSQCLERFLLQIPGFRYLSVGYCDFFTDKILEKLIDSGKFVHLEAIDLSHTTSLGEAGIQKLILNCGDQLKGLALHGKPALVEYFWIKAIRFLKQLQICSLGAAHGWFFKFNTRVHIDQIMEMFGTHCSKLNALEIQWDPETLRFSDKSRKFIDHLRLGCPQLQSLTLSDGQYYEMVKSNFERADRYRVVRTITTFQTSTVQLISSYKDLQFN